MHGVGFVHETMSEEERTLVELLFSAGHVGVLVAPQTMAWRLSVQVHAVVIMDTQQYDGREHKYVDVPVSDLLQMMGRASRPDVDDVGVCHVLTASSKREALRRFLFEPLPLESHLDLHLHDAFTAEVVAGTIESKQDAVDWLTWSFFYRRLPQNPNYYGLAGATPRHLSDHLSELVERTLADLATSRCISVDDDEGTVASLNLGVIASYYRVAYTTLELFHASLTPKTKRRGLLEILAASSEFAELPVRHGEDRLLENLARHLPQAMAAGTRFRDPHTKANVLLQAHFSRTPLPADLRLDRDEVVRKALPLVGALVDVIASNGWMRPAIAAMELSQMCVQAVWVDEDGAALHQMPHFDPALVRRCLDFRWTDAEGESHVVDSVYEFLQLDDEPRRALLRDVPVAHVSDVAQFCNRYPNINVEFTIRSDEENEDEEGGQEGGEDTEKGEGAGRPRVSLRSGGAATVEVRLDRGSDAEGLEEGAGVGAVVAPLFPVAKSEGWWVAVGDPAKNKLLGIRRVTIGATARANVAVELPAEGGEHSLQLFLISDSYVGCDQEYEIPVLLKERA